MLRSRSTVVVLLALAAGAVGLWAIHLSRRARYQAATPTSEQLAFAQSYLNPAAGRKNTKRRACADCHDWDDLVDPDKWKVIKARAKLGRSAWEQSLNLAARCASCHLVPDPATLPSRSWMEALARMEEIMKSRAVPNFTPDEWLDLRHYYFSFSRETLHMLPPDPVLGGSPIKFERSVFGNPKGEPEQPFIGHLQCVDLDLDHQLDVLVCDTGHSAVKWIHRDHGSWVEQALAELPFPAHAQVVTNSSSGRLDVIVACQSQLAPTDDAVGRVVLLENEGGMKYKASTLLDQIGRVADVEPADFNGDGKNDFVIAAYGYLIQGEVGWLERTADRFEYHPVLKRTGAINTLPVDLNGDGHMDFVVLFAQEHEQISAFLNDGSGKFTETVLFKAATPAFGSSGIQLVDLNRDGDLDILYTNGDNMDLTTVLPRPFHGVQWLENKGNLQFEWHNIRRFYGAYSAVAGDLNGDGHLDIVVTSMFNEWNDPRRASLIWLENDGHCHFQSHTIATEPIHLICAALGDLDHDGRLDVIAGAVNAFPPYDPQRMGRITLWRNGGPISGNLKADLPGARDKE